ncbi:MAG: pirin family protein [Armatimonas sp.]
MRRFGVVMKPGVVEEAPGVHIGRTIGSDRLILLDPFLLLDHMQVGDAAASSIGFPRHPHRGIETLTWMVAGRVHHKDSQGSDDSVGAGEAQWMTAGKGIFHSEMLEQTAEGCEGLQLWFNLPATQKFIPAGYQAARKNDIPMVTSDGATVSLVAGTYQDTTGPLDRIAVQPTVLGVTLSQGASVTLPAPPGQNAFAYVHHGSVTDAQGKTVDAAQLAIFTDGENATITTTSPEGAALLFCAAKPLNEPVFLYRSLVLSNVDQMAQALDDLENDTFA